MLQERVRTIAIFYDLWPIIVSLIFASVFCGELSPAIYTSVLYPDRQMKLKQEMEFCEEYQGGCQGQGSWNQAGSFYAAELYKAKYRPMILGSVRADGFPNNRRINRIKLGLSQLAMDMIL